jgi:hypothetical protein
MTNEQLQILLLLLADKLEHAVNTADADLGDGVERHESQRYVGSALIPPFFGDRRPGEWETVRKMAVALDPVRDAVDEIRKHAAAMSHNAEVRGD